jgi:hypothetical protein
LTALATMETGRQIGDLKVMTRFFSARGGSPGKMHPLEVTVE